LTVQGVSFCYFCTCTWYTLIKLPLHYSFLSPPPCLPLTVFIAFHCVLQSYSSHHSLLPPTPCCPSLAVCLPHSCHMMVKMIQSRVCTWGEASNACLSELRSSHSTWWSLVPPCSCKWHNFILLYNQIYIYIFFSLSRNFFKDESKLFKNKTDSFVFCSIASSQIFL
jgi:hypothetical protein